MKLALSYSRERRIKTSVVDVRQFSLPLWDCISGSIKITGKNLETDTEKPSNPPARRRIMERIKLVEKKNHHHVHALFMSRESAERHLRETIPDYIRKGYFMDKTLTAADFEIIESK